ncbi:MAG: TonB-dependent receptor plug [Sediminibacterium sp.]|nr:TonB-dependent receptor plug [Sediminibacterium sp.]
MKTTLHQLIAVFVCGFALFFSIDAIAQGRTTTPQQNGYKSIYDMLRDVPGLEVKANSKGGGSIIIRGVGSLMNQKQPLFVLDGVIYGGDIGSLNPQDIAGISVLKDAASAGAYGAQGAAGVIMITTRNGSGGGGAFVSNHTESAYTYFIDHKTPLKVFGMNDEVIIEGVIQKQRDSSLVFMNRRKEVVVLIKNIKRVEMIPQ